MMTEGKREEKRRSRIVFMGTPLFAVPVFYALAERYEVCAVFTQPDRPKGRGMKTLPSPVKEAALEKNIPVFTPCTLRKKGTAAQLTAFGADFFVVAAYGLILPQRVLDIPRMGCINVHGSLLPKYRGASPIQYALINGETATGITIMYMDKGIDTGDIILQKEIPIGPDENFTSLHDHMAALGAECIIDALVRIENGTAARTPQENELATYAGLIEKQHGLIDWHWHGAKIKNRVRALDPWMGAYVMVNGQPFKIWRCGAVEYCDSHEPPGTILSADNKKGMLVRTGGGAVWVAEVQAPGKKRMFACDFLRGQAAGFTAL